MKRVDSAPILQAVYDYLGEGHTWSEICRRLGWMQEENKPESSRLQKALGIRPERGVIPERKKLNYKTAVGIVQAIERSPVEFDL